MIRGALLAVLLGACGTDVGPSADAGPDAGVDAELALSSPDIPWLDRGAPPLTPCPAGWREAIEADVVTCDPYPAEGRAECEVGEGHFPGEPGCRPIGDPCPPGDYAEGLPTDGSVVYVSSTATPGGDGSLAAPYTLATVPWLTLDAGTTIALAKGTYEDAISLRPDLHVVGACVAETRLAGSTLPVPGAINVATRGEPASVRNVAIASPPQRGVMVTDGGALALRGVLVEGGTGYGISVRDAGSRVTLEDVVVRDTRWDASGHARGVEVLVGAHLDTSRTIIERNREIGLLAAEPGTEVVLVDSAVVDIRPYDFMYASGLGISVQAGARLEASRTLIARNRDRGLFADGAETEVELTDVVVRENQPHPIGERAQGRGLMIQGGAHVLASRLLVAANEDTGVFILSAELDASHVVIARNVYMGLIARDAGTVVRLADSAVLDSLLTADGRAGRGIHVQDAAQVEALRVLVSGSKDAGVIARGTDARALLTDVVIRDTRARGPDGTFGFGAQAISGASITGERVVVDGAKEIGLVAADRGSIDLTDVVVANVQRTLSGDPSRTLGYAVVAISGAVHLYRFHVRDAETCGLFVAREALAVAPDLDVETGIVERSEVGACVQVGGYDISRLMRDVAYRDNGVNLDVTTLPIPPTPDPLAD